jgi:hypothetical protein
VILLPPGSGIASKTTAGILESECDDGRSRIGGTDSICRR